MTLQLSYVTVEECAFEQEIHTVSSYPASTFCFAVTAPVLVSITKLPVEYAVLHPYCFNEHEVIAPNKVE